MQGRGRARVPEVAKNSVLPLILGGATLQRCDNCTVLNAALAAEGHSSRSERLSPQPVQPCRNHCRPPNFFHHIFPVRSSQTCTPNRCEDTSSVHHRELRQSPETNAFPAANVSPLFDNIWPRSAPPQVHAKRQNSTLSPIF